MMEQQIRWPDRCTMRNCNSVAIFGGWQNLEVWHIRIYVWPQLWIKVQRLCKKRYEGNPLLRVIKRWIFTHFSSCIQTLRNDQEAMPTVQFIVAQEFELFTISSFLRPTENGIYRHETNDPGASVEREATRGISLQIPSRFRLSCDCDELIQLLNERRCDVECALYAILQTETIDWDRIGNGINLHRDVPYPYYDLETVESVTLPSRNTVLTNLDAPNRPIFELRRNV